MAKPSQSQPPDSRTLASMSDGGHYSAKTPIHTAPITEARRGASFEGSSAVIALRELDGDVVLDLPEGTQAFMLGASRNKCSLVVRRDGISATHALLERRDDRMRLVDQASTNGTFVHDIKVRETYIFPGDVFRVGPMTLYALNAEMRQLRPAMLDLLGARSKPSADRLLLEAARGSANLLITGEAHCGQDELAHVIHAVSLRRQREGVDVGQIPGDRADQRALLDRAARSTLALSIAPEQRRLDPIFVESLLSPDYCIRLIVLAPTIDAARAALPQDAVEGMEHIRLRPLRQRSDDIDRLLDRELAKHGAPFTAADLTCDNLSALRQWAWPNNFADLSVAVQRMMAYVAHHSFRKAAASLGMKRTTLQKYFEKLGLSTSLLVNSPAPAD
jgi:pSer/pThr/pTyr-binding forkhead associated (FHA) protein